MAEISKIQRAVEMPDAKKKAFLNLIKTCNGVITKEGGLYMSDGSLILNKDVKKGLEECSRLDSGLAKAVMLIFGRPNLDHAVPKAELIDKKADREALVAFDMSYDNRFKDDINKSINEIAEFDKNEPNSWGNIHLLMNEKNPDYANTFSKMPKETTSDVNEGLIRELHDMLDEDKISEAITLSEELLESEDLPGVKGLLGKGIDDIKSHLQTFRPVWQEYQDYAEPENENGERVSIAEMQTRLTYNERRIADLDEQITMEEDKIKRLIDRKTRMQEENAGIQHLLGETQQKVKEVVGADVLEFPKPAIIADIDRGMDLEKSASADASADTEEREGVIPFPAKARGINPTDSIMEGHEATVIPLKQSRSKETPDDIA